MKFSAAGAAGSLTAHFSSSGCAPRLHRSPDATVACGGAAAEKHFGVANHAPAPAGINHNPGQGRSLGHAGGVATPNLTADMRRLIKQRIDERRRELENEPADGLLHGTEWAYKQGCRCDKCRQTCNEKRRDRRRRAAGVPHNRDKTHCIRGHEFTVENTYIRSRGGAQDRECRACRRETARGRRAKKEDLS